MDIVDETNQTFERLHDMNLSAIRSKARQININGPGYCVVCGGDVETVIYDGEQVIKRFCGDECRDKHDE